MSRTALWALGRASAAALLAVLAGGSSASAHAVATAGGTAYAEPEITGVRCAPSDASPSCIPGEDLRVSGESLEDTRAVVFLGRKGRADDRRVRPLKASPHRVLVQVPAEAASGRVRVIEPDVALTGPRV